MDCVAFLQWALPRMGRRWAGYRKVRKLLAQQYSRDHQMPDIQVVRYDRDSDRSLTLRHRLHRGRPLASDGGNRAPPAHYLYGRTRLLYLMQSK